MVVVDIRLIRMNPITKDTAESQSSQSSQSIPRVEDIQKPIIRNNTIRGQVTRLPLQERIKEGKEGETERERNKEKRRGKSINNSE